MKYHVGVMVLAGLCLLAGGCAGTKSTEDKSNNYSYLDDKTLEKMDNDLSLLAQAIDRADENSESSLRRGISEQARRYQVALISALSDYSSTPRRRLAGVVLGFTGDVSVIGPLLDKINDEDEPESVRINAVLGLATLGEKLRDYPRHDQLMNTLRAVMANKDTSPSMRRTAIAAYAVSYDKVLNDSISPVVDRFVGDSVMGVQVAAVNALGDIGDVSATSDLIYGLSLPSDELRVASAIALGKLADPNKVIVPALIAASEDDEAADVRREALSSLVSHFRGDPDVVFGALLFGLSDLDDAVRESAAIALAETTDERAIDSLIQATGDRSAQVRLAAAESLPLLVTKEKESLAYPLVDLISDQNPLVSRAAQSSLVKITGKNLGENQSQWRQYFYKAYPALDPATAYVGKPKPRMTSNLQGSGGSRTSGTRTSGTRTSGSRTPSSGTRTSGNTGRTNNSGNRNTGNTGRTGR
ncbi:MAG: HEAT repeat domain-containing protein [Planctomycetes bacterium]|nr:HEAT repeat domain-containing protein [Planctomycetota bacterium]